MADCFFPPRFWRGVLFLIAPFPDSYLLVPFCIEIIGTGNPSCVHFRFKCQVWQFDFMRARDSFEKNSEATGSKNI